MGTNTTLPRACRPAKLNNQGRSALVKQVSKNLISQIKSGKAHSYLAALWSPLSPGCRTVSLCLAWSEAGAALFPAVVWRSLRHGSSPAARDSCPPAGSWTSPSLCGSSSNAPPCQTQPAEGRWIPSAVRTRLCEMVFLNCNVAQKTQSHSI